MSKPLVCEYLKDHTLRQLEDDHGVAARPNSTFDKFSLNYDQILIKNGDLLAEQCRGMVIRPELLMLDRDAKPLIDMPDDGWKDAFLGNVILLAWPMNRFYNLGDQAGAQVDWGDPNLRVYEKLDGTMVVVYWDPLAMRWYAATRSVSQADLPIRGGDFEIGDMTFSDLFFKALKATREELSGEALAWEPKGFDQVVHLNKELTYVFELTSPHNRIVVKYDSPRVTLLAARHTATGKEVPIESLRLEHVQRPKVWSLSDPTAIDAFVNAADPSELEGCVVCDSQFRRLKVKNKAWVLSSRAKDMVSGTTRRGAIEAILAGTIDDVIPLVEKSIADELTKLRDDLRDYLKAIDRNFVAWKEEAAGQRKRFAELVVLSGDWPTPYFQLLDDKGRDALDWAVSSQAAGRLSPRMLDTFLEKIRGSTTSVPKGAVE